MIFLAQIKERGNIVVAMEGTNNGPYHDDNNDLLAGDVRQQNTRRKTGVEAGVCRGRVGCGLLAGLETGRYDIMVNGVGVTDECRKVHLLYPICIIRLLLSFATITMRFLQWKI